MRSDNSGCCLEMAYLYWRVYPYFKLKDELIPRLRVGEKLRIVSISLHYINFEGAKVRENVKSFP